MYVLNWLGQLTLKNKKKQERTEHHWMSNDIKHDKSTLVFQGYIHWYIKMCPPFGVLQSWMKDLETFVAGLTPFIARCWHFSKYLWAPGTFIPQKNIDELTWVQVEN